MIEWYTQAHPFLPSLGFYEKENGFTVARDFNLISPLSSAVVSTLTRVSNGGQACIEWFVLLEYQSRRRADYGIDEMD